MNEMSTAPDPIMAALDQFGDKLTAESKAQLATLLRSDYSGIPAGAIRDLISIRVNAPEYQKFFNASRGASPAPSSPAAPANPQADQVTDQESRQVASLRASMAARGMGQNRLAGMPSDNR